MNDVQGKSKGRATLPGPKAKALIERDARVVSPSYVRDYPFVISHGRGAEVWDVDGNRFVDFASGIAVCSTGHSHPAVVAAIQEAARHFLHISCDYWHEGQVQLAEKMAALDPVSGPAVTFFANSGSESVEAALKIARHTSKRPRVIGFLGAFHGRTMGSLAVTASKYTQQRGFFPAMPGVVHVPYPNPYRPLFAGADQGQAVIAYIETLFERNIPADEVAAILVEPIQGEGGYVVPPDGFLAGLRALCDKHGILLIFDEVQAGIGRTGKMFAWQHTGVRPDIITLAKGIGSGLPIGLAVGAKKVMEKLAPGSHANTFGGNPLCCAAALATLKLVEEGYAQNAALMGERAMRRLRELAAKYPVIGDIRGRGLMIGVEFVQDRSTKAPAKALATKLVNNAYQNGLLLLECGASGIRLIPPLMIDQGLLDEGLDILELSLQEALA
ncbi:MAG TPA: acetyl ornithine aminotransferase family protein [Steroidobacteraceae bacterium]|nr:acetyl ornithine aminotransferase family protein [Steroidobacteraceae bacterium]